MTSHTLTMDRSRLRRRNNIFRGTIILTLAGFITRVIGFFYKIYLSNAMGTEWLGIYQLVFPVFSICYTIFATGIQTSISRMIAAQIGKKNYKNAYKILRIGLLLSTSIALLLSILVFKLSDYIAWRFLLEARSASSLRVLAFAFPFCGVTSCINGYYYGLKKAGVPATTQLVEQVSRVLVVYMIAAYAGKGDFKVTCELAVLGIVIGEAASCIFNLLSILASKYSHARSFKNQELGELSYGRKKILKDLLSLSVPLSANRLFINILHSMEAVLIPTMLRRFGLTTSDSLITYGVLTGMTMPFIMFPTALINALSVLLLPTVSEAQAANNERLIGRTAAVSIKYSLLVGIVSTGIFIIFGNELGNAVFHNTSSGSYLIILAWLCPLIYLTTTLSSIINGLGKAHITFIHSIIGTSSKILMIIILIPKCGIKGYLAALLVGQLILTILDSASVIRYVRFDFDAVNSILKPGIIVAFLGFLIKEIFEYMQKATQNHRAYFVLSFCLLFCVLCIGLFMITQTVSKKDFK